MFQIKKTTAAILALGSSMAFSGTMGPVCTPGNVTVPCEMNAWDVGISALYLQPNFNADWGYAEWTDNDVGDRNYVEFRPDWDWGFKLEGSYHFGRGNDFNINWYHLDNELRHNDYVRNQGQGQGGLNNWILYSSFEQKWDAVNFEFGKRMDLDEFSFYRFHGGAAYVRIDHNGSFLINTQDGILNTLDTLSVDYRGFGPRVGADFNYVFGNGFGIYAKAATALFIGTSDFTVTNQAGAGGAVGVRHGSKRALVPELEAKLGAAYNYSLSNGVITLDGGYMWVNYFNALHNDAAFRRAGEFFEETDFGLNGPYIGLKWIGSL